MAQGTDFRFDLMKMELDLTQGQMDKYDTMSISVKAWAVTLWIASIGWAFQVHGANFILLSCLIVVLFWFFDGLNKTFRQGYKKRRDEVSAALRYFFEKGRAPSDFVSPQLPMHDFKDALRNGLTMHVGIPYIVLCAVSLIVYSGF